MKVFCQRTADSQAMTGKGYSVAKAVYESLLAKQEDLVRPKNYPALFLIATKYSGL